MAPVSSRAFESHVLICMSHHFSAFQLPCADCPWKEKKKKNSPECLLVWVLLSFTAELSFVPDLVSSVGGGGTHVVLSHLYKSPNMS